MGTKVSQDRSRSHRRRDRRSLDLAGFGLLVVSLAGCGDGDDGPADGGSSGQGGEPAAGAGGQAGSGEAGVGDSGGQAQGGSDSGGGGSGAQPQGGTGRGGCSGTAGRGGVSGCGGTGGRGGSSGTSGEGGSAGGGGDGGSTDETCEGVTCSGHGACEVVGGEAECACDDFYDVVDHTQCILRECGSGVPGVDCRCLSVEPSGNDADAAASEGRTAFRNIQPAVDYAFAHPTVAEHVCVAAGVTCTESFSYSSPPEGLVMRNAVSVHGGYESVGLTPCQTGGHTEIVLDSALGVYFGPDIDRPTKLERFSLARHTGATSAGVTVTGARDVSLAYLSITGGLESDVLYGVDVSGGARVALDAVGSSYEYVPGVPLATGDVIYLHVVQSLVQAVRNHATVYVEGGSATCAWFEDAPGSTFDDGRCTLWQMYPGASSLAGIRILGDAEGVGIEGNTLTVGAPSSGEVASRRIIDIEGSGKVDLIDNVLVSEYGVGEVTGVRAIGASVELNGSVRAESSSGAAHGIWLEDAPASTVENAAITVRARGNMANMGVGLRVRGDAANTSVRSSTIEVEGGGEQAAAIWFEDCAGASPIIADNPLVTVSTSTGAMVDAIRSVGACHPSIERNGVISAVSNGTAVTTAIRCGASEQGPSRCVIVDNPDIQAGMVNSTAASGSAFGVACEAGCCAEISRNEIIGLGRFELGCSRSCYPEASGIYLIQANTLIEGNTVSAGCADRASGIHVESGTARIVDNAVIARSNCPYDPINVILFSYGLYSLGGVEADSNLFDPGVTSPSLLPCISAGIRASGGTFTNNTLRAGECETNAPFMTIP